MHSPRIRRAPRPAARAPFASAPVLARTTRRSLGPCLCLCLCLFGETAYSPAAAQPVATSRAPAPLLERVLAVPLRIERPGALPVSRAIPVRVVRVAGPGRRPFIVLLHGRPVDRTDAARMGVVDYPANAAWLARAGFVVLIPTRIGYGAAGGPDLEYGGECDDKRLAPGLDAAAAELRQVVEAARRETDIDPAHGLVLGESYGGMIAVGAAGGALPGVLGTINVAGGDGGDSLRHPDRPCSPGAVQTAFERAARTAHLPTLWLYSANDRLWGPRWPRAWFAAYSAAGGRGRFIELPPDKNNGHFIFNRNREAWQPYVHSFAVELGVIAP